MMLSLYYTFVIVYNWKETRLKKIRKWMHVVPIVAGFSLAFAGIPYYRNAISMCCIAPPPIEEFWTKFLMFTAIPIAFVIVFTTITMTLVYLKVRKDSRSSNRWRVDGASKKRTTPSALEKDVFHQCVFYLLAFYVSWPILIIASARSAHIGYGLVAAVQTLAPIQGFNNCLVYARPRFVRYLRNRKKGRKKKAGESPAPITGCTSTPHKWSFRCSFLHFLSRPEDAQMSDNTSETHKRRSRRSSLPTIFRRGEKMEGDDV
jgi:hypothetical protein